MTVCLYQSVIQVKMGKDIQDRNTDNNGHIDQRNSIGEYLTNGCNNQDPLEQQQRCPQKRTDAPVVLNYHRELHNQHEIRDNVTDPEVFASLVTVVCIKGIVQSGKLRQDNQTFSDHGQNADKAYSFRQFLLFLLICEEQICQIEAECIVYCRYHGK